MGTGRRDQETPINLERHGVSERKREVNERVVETINRINALNEAAS